ncbi:exo-beta-1,3-glucanase [Mycena galericulata]|nr:exo-beta-1,3-glucanase [Mycena galericulata]
MLPAMFLSAMGMALGSATLVSALGTSCSTPLGGGTAAATDPFWLQNIQHQGIAAYNPSPSSYQVFRNVMNFGAKGDGVTDDTNGAFSLSHSRPLDRVTDAQDLTALQQHVIPRLSLPSTMKTTSLIVERRLIGDATAPPTLLATAGFAGIAVIDADVYIPGASGAEWYVNQDNLIPATSTGTGIHWQVSQSTSLINIVINMSTASNTAHQVYIKASGWKMAGKFGMWVGNQQFTVRNVTVNNANTAVFGVWNWGWTFQNININNCQVGFDLSTGTTATSQTIGAEAIIDATVANTPIFVRTATAANGKVIGAGSLVLNNIKLTNVPTAVGVVGGAVVLAGGTTTIASWGQGNVFKGTSPTAQFTQGTIPSPSKPAVLLDSTGKIFGRTHPQYAGYAVSQFVSVRSQGAKGDGVTDDTAALKAIFAAYSGCKIIFFDAGTYIVTSTLQIPAGTQLVGEGWSVIAGKGAAFQNVNSPQVVVQVGAPGSSGVLEITDIIFATVGPTAGAIVVEWNVKQTTQGGAGMWDSHIRLGGADGTNLQTANCPASGSGGTTNCYSSFLALHLTAGSTAYLEGTWVWNADHDLDGNGYAQLSLYSGRGILSQSAGPVWLIGTGSEHHALYQYSLVGAQNHYMGLIQTETPYYQPNPAAPGPFTVNSAYSDPSFSGTSSAWGLVVSSSSNILVFGAGLYSFYSSYGQGCLTPENCQSQIVNIDSTSSVSIYNLQTIGTTYQISVNNAGVVNQNSNPNGEAATLTVWTQ